MNTRRAGIWFPPLLLVAALLPLGARSEPALDFILVLVALAFFLTAVVSIARQGVSSTVEFLFSGTSPAMILVLPLLVTVQLLLQLTAGFSKGPVSSMLQSAMLLATLSLFYLFVRCAAAEQRSFRILLGALVVIGSLEGGYGLLNLLAGNEHLLIYKRWAYQRSATGTLISRNHFAFLMEMLLPAAVAFAVLFGSTHRGPSQRASEVTEQSARKALIASAVLILGLALVFSASRMGIVSFLLATGVVAVMNRGLRPRSVGAAVKQHGQHALALTLAVLIFGYALVIGLDFVLERFFLSVRDLELGRWVIWRPTLAMIADKPLIGHGWGTFEALLPGYRRHPTGVFYNHAHNEYLEVWAEAGLAGLIAVVWMLLAFTRRLLRTLALPLAPAQRTTVVALAISIVSVLLHSAADFGLRVPGVAFLFVAVAALFSRVTEDPSLAGPTLAGRSGGRPAT